MEKLQLTRSAHDRRLYELGSVGTLLLEGWTKRAATATAGERAWLIKRGGLLKTEIVATDAAGVVAGTFTGHSLKRGGTLRWAERELDLRPDSHFKERYVLRAGEQRLATLNARAWGKHAVDVTVESLATIDPGLLLFAAFAVRSLADAAQASGA
jgi:hypothetical protein